MPITATARRNHDRLFPQHESTLATTDQEQRRDASEVHRRTLSQGDVPEVADERAPRLGRSALSLPPLSQN